MESCSGGAGVVDDAAWRGGAGSRLRGRTTPPRCRSEVEEDWRQQQRSRFAGGGAGGGQAAA
ncbi:hypothetical protein Scep_018815 [Stephania cephalantha]|uniref:Uncharacterized protein n=1 Tax=Stephania cephalantha TaxID=152367 RepID=A0AAP0NP74_9MAGN